MQLASITIPLGQFRDRFFKVRVLIIEDDRDISANLCDHLAAEGHDLDLAEDGVTGLHFAVRNEYDAIVLDLGLPGMDGVKVCEKLRQEARRNTPVLMLTAHDTLEDRLEGFANGADDYLVKPFALSELSARLQALHRRHRGHVADAVLQFADLCFDPQALTVTRGGKAIKLPRKCLRLLELFMRQPNRVFSHQELELAAWGEVLERSDSLRTHMRTLRKALAQDGKPELIQTVSGIGYKLTDPA